MSDHRGLGSATSFSKPGSRKCYFCFCQGRVAPWTAVTSKASLTVQRHAVLRVGVSHLLVYRVPFEFASGEVWGHHFFVEDKAPLVIAWLSTGSLSQGPPPLPSLAPASTALNRWAETPRALLVALPLLSLPWPPSPFLKKKKFFLMFISETETEHERGRGRRERGRQNVKQTPSPELSAQSPTRGSNP